VLLTRSARHHGLPNKFFIDDNHNIPIVTYNPFSSPIENNATTKHHPYREPHLNIKGNGERTSTF